MATGETDNQRKTVENSASAVHWRRRGGNLAERVCGPKRQKTYGKPEASRQRVPPHWGDAAAHWRRRNAHWSGDSGNGSGRSGAPIATRQRRRDTCAEAW